MKEIQSDRQEDEAADKAADQAADQAENQGASESFSDEFKRRLRTSTGAIIKPRHTRRQKDAGQASNPAGTPVYDPAIADRTVRPNEILRDERFWQVARTLTAFVAGSITDKYGYGEARDLSQTQLRQRKASRIRQALIELGPTFVKLGQFLSVRRDILPPEMADELAQLQDNVPPFEISRVKEIIERDLGRNPEALFDRFEETPVASASIGQVHRAWLKDGTAVVVKVQRPNLASRFYQDLGYMRLVTRMGSVLRPTGEWESWLKLSDEFGRTLFSEINYLQEGKNADRLRTFLKDHQDIRIPRVFWKYTGKRVLTLEYIPGIKVDQVDELRESGLDLVSIGNRLVTCYLDQVLLHGFFHADPHAGNMAIDHHGNIVLYDFGMIGRITEAQRNAITGCIAAVIKNDIEELIKHLTDLEIIRPGASVEPIKRAIKPFIEYYAGRGIRDLDFGTIEEDVDEIATDRALRMPPTLAYLIRTGSSLEGIARTLHPNFSFVEAAKPSLKKWVLNKPEQAAQVLKLLGSAEQMSLRAVWQRLTRVKKTAESPLQFLDSTNNDTLIPERVSPDLLRKPLPDSNEVTALKSRLNLLENEIADKRKNGVNLLVQALWFLSFALLYFGTSLIPEYQSYAKFFLIGNGVMVAIILGHLVRSSKLRDGSTKDSSRRQRR